jgi:hypothetical protein
MTYLAGLNVIGVKVFHAYRLGAGSAFWPRAEGGRDRKILATSLH